MSANLSVLFEDNHCLAVVKPPGLLTAGDRTGDVTLLERARQYLKEKYHKPGNVYLGLVHRLDRPVSGVVLFARTSKAAARLSEQFRTRGVTKVYHAWVQGLPRTPAGTWTDFLLKDRERNVVQSVSTETAGARRAVLEYRLLRRTRRTALLEIRPQTGRTHQIRVQLASRGLPIVGDVKYGGRPTPSGRLLLHAFELTFQHPIRNEAISVQAPEPDDWLHELPPDAAKPQK